MYADPDIGYNAFLKRWSGDRRRDRRGGPVVSRLVQFFRNKLGFVTPDCISTRLL
jgi:hypothetical protein